jgi:HK97 family phage portal protein
VTVFQSLGALGAHLEATGMKLQDPGVPLWDATAGGGEFGPVWSEQPSVRKVVAFIARNIASIPLHVYDRVADGDRVRVTDHPLSRTVARPSLAPGQTPYRFWESVLIDGLIFDRWCLMKVGQDDATIELVRIPARRVRFKADALDRVEKVLIWGHDGESKEYDPRKFILDVGYSERGASGTSPMRTLRHLLAEATEAVEYRRSVWKNGARFPLVLERDTPFSSDAAFERFRASWSAFIRGGAREGGTPILEDGMKARALEGFKPQDTGDLEGRRLTDIETASAYHIAPELVGAREGNFSNVEAFRQSLYRDNLGPYIEAWVQALNAGLTPELAGGRDLYIEPHLEAKLRGSFEEQARILSSAIGAPWMSRSEGRGRMNLPAIDGADDLVVPLNVLIGGQASPRDSGSQNQNSRTTGQKHVRVKARAPQTYQEKHQEVLTAFFKRQGAAVLSALGAKADGDWWDQDRWDSELGADLFRLAVMTSESVAKSVLGTLGFPSDDYDVDRTLAFLTALTTRVAGAINGATKHQLDAALGDEDPTSALKHVFEIAQTSRAEQSSLTAVTSVSGFASMEAAKQVAGDNATKTWVVMSSNPRASHAAIDGETVPIGSDFSNGLPWPGGGGDADEVAGCTCDLQINV